MDKMINKLAELESEFADAGGRGVELAEEIDELRSAIENKKIVHTNYVIQDGSEFEYKLTMPEHERVWLKLKGADIGILYNADGISIDVHKHGAALLVLKSY